MNTKSIGLIACLTLLATSAHAATVVYSSVPNLAATPNQQGICSSCSGNYEELDEFTLSKAATITGLNLVTYSGIPSYNGLGGFTFEVYDSAHSTILFSAPTTTVSTLSVLSGQNIEVTADISALNLSAGTYWAGFLSESLAVALLPGGNGFNILTPVPDSGDGTLVYDGNIGYQLLGSVSAVPEPSTWFMLLIGFAAIGFAGYRKHVTAPKRRWIEQ